MDQVVVMDQVDGMDKAQMSRIYSLWVLMTRRARVIRVVHRTRRMPGVNQEWDERNSLGSRYRMLHLHHYLVRVRFGAEVGCNYIRARSTDECTCPVRSRLNKAKLTARPVHAWVRVRVRIRLVGLVQT